MRQQLSRVPPPQVPTLAASEQAGAEPEPSPAAACDPEACARALEEAEALVAAGRHADALAATDAWLLQFPALSWQCGCTRCAGTATRRWAS